MKIYPKYLIILVSLTLPFIASGQNVINLDPQQSMCITGKGQGQDAAINPYLGEASIATAENTGESALSVRIQEKGNFLYEVLIPANKVKEFRLEKDYVLYIDSTLEGQAKISFKKAPAENPAIRRSF